MADLYCFFLFHQTLSTLLIDYYRVNVSCCCCVTEVVVVDDVDVVFLCGSFSRRNGCYCCCVIMTTICAVNILATEACFFHKWV